MHIGQISVLLYMNIVKINVPRYVYTDVGGNLKKDTKCQNTTLNTENHLTNHI
jgi:hypothetical protein